MKKAAVAPNISASNKFFYKYAQSMPTDLRQAVVQSMKGMLGSHKAVAVRVAAS